MQIVEGWRDFGYESGIFIAVSLLSTPQDERLQRWRYSHPVSLQQVPTFEPGTTLAGTGVEASI